MAELVSEALWKQIEPPVASWARVRARVLSQGRPTARLESASLGGNCVRAEDGVPWQSIPREMNCGSGSTCWRRFAEWTQLSVWPRLHTLILSALGRAGKVNLSRAVIDSASVRATFGGTTRAPIRPIAQKGLQAARADRCLRLAFGRADHTGQRAR